MLKRIYCPVLFRHLPDYSIVAVLPHQRVQVGNIQVYNRKGEFSEIAYLDYVDMPLADQCDDTDALLDGLRMIFEPAGHKSVHEVKTRNTLTSDWRKHAWGELTEMQQAIHDVRPRIAKPKQWSRGYILEVARMLRLLHPMMSEAPFNAYCNMWADTIMLANPRFQRERFLRDCWIKQQI